MLQEDYVSFEQAKELKELGFPQDAPHMGFYLLDNSKVLSDWKNGDYDMPSGYYDIRDVYEDEIGKLILNKSFTNEQFDYNDWSSFYSKEYHSNQYHNVAIRPTLSLARKWLREEKKTYIHIGYVADWRVQTYIVRYLEDRMPNIQSKAIISNTEEEALSAGIDMAIKSIKAKEG